VLAQADVEQVALSPAQLEQADAVFLCNAVRGILPAGSLGERRWAMHPALEDLRRRLGRSEPAFA
jgi:4-amino-4-deoxychorismate lyase